jgi:dihydroorotate dehydrogenase (fumarate)/dihydroorotate dehydrogenase
MTVYKSLIRPALFCLPAELAHHASVDACRLVGSLPLLPKMIGRSLSYQSPELTVEFHGLRFANPIGLAAGWDKSGRALRMLEHLGFGFAEIGSISAWPSQGNPKPRLFRLPQDQAIVVNYGLPNDGAIAISKRLDGRKLATMPLGINIVKTNRGSGAPPCSSDEIIDDYVQSARLLHMHASYLTLNLSCPNAEGGKDFFVEPGCIRRLLQSLAVDELSCPVFLKVAPDPSPSAIERVVEESDSFGFVKGLMFNLPAGKPSTIRLATEPSLWSRMPGSVAGRPVAALIDQCIYELRKRMPPRRFIIIGGGGVFNAEDAYRKICLGASLVQVYTALIYEGPGVVKRINRGLSRLLARDGYERLQHAVGTIDEMVDGVTWR